MCRAQYVEHGDRFLRWAKQQLGHSYAGCISPLVIGFVCVCFQFAPSRRDRSFVQVVQMMLTGRRGGSQSKSDEAPVELRVLLPMGGQDAVT